MSEQISTEYELPENIADAPELDPPSAKRVRGRPITKENAKEFQLSSARAKKMRKEARAKMLQAMCTKLDLGEQLVDAIRKNDATKMSIVEKALTIVGLTHNQSSEAIAQKLDIKSDNKVDARVAVPSLNITFTDKKESD